MEITHTWVFWFHKADDMDGPQIQMRLSIQDVECMEATKTTKDWTCVHDMFTDRNFLVKRFGSKGLIYKEV